MSGYSSNDDRSGALVHGVKIDPAVARKAGLYVAHNARDFEDCRLLLDALGLLGLPLRSSRTVANRRHAQASKARRKETT